MRLYNSNTENIEEIEKTIISTNGLIIYTKHLDIQELNVLGFYQFKYLIKPNLRYFNFTENKNIIDNVFTVSYDKTDKPLVHIKNLLSISVINRAKELFNKATEKYSAGEMSVWNELERQAHNVIADEVGTDKNLIIDEAALTNETEIERANKIIDKANELKTLRNYIISNRANKLRDIDNMITIDECILYEDTPYEIDETDIETGVVNTVTRYKNLCTDW